MIMKRYALAFIPILVLFYFYPYFFVEFAPEFSLKNEIDTKPALILAEEWADQQSVNPVELRFNYESKGYKRYVELLRLYKALNKTEKVEKLLNIAYSEEYHYLNRLSEKEFREEIISYLTAYQIIEEMGLKNELYKSNIELLKPKIMDHIKTRGLNQQESIKRKLNLDYDVKGIKLIDIYLPYQFICLQKTYDLTHWVFVYDKSDFNFIQINYLKYMLPRLINKYIKEDNPDIVAELLMNMNELGLKHQEGMKFLINSQNDDGSFGNYPPLEYKDIDLSFFLYLHTTSVATQALSG